MIRRDLPSRRETCQRPPNESGHKHVLQARLKQTGSAWNPDHADALAQLRVLRSNSLWDDFWDLDLAA